MTKKLLINLFIGGFVFGLCSSVNAGKPVDDFGIPFGNGFPSGEHYNLNIHGLIINYRGISHYTIVMS